MEPEHALASTTLSDILNHSRTMGNYHTHVSMVHPKGSFNIHRKIIEQFWDAYCTALSEEEEKFVFGIAEKLSLCIPVLVDVDIKVPFTEDMNVKRLYTKPQLENVVGIYHTVLRKILKDPQSKHFICFVLEKPAYRVTSGDHEFIKSGFHLHFPYVFMQKQDHETHLLPRVIQEMKNRNIFENLGIDSSKVIDPAYLKAPWLLYGSRKDGVDMRPYELNRVYNEEMDEVTLEEALAEFKLFDVDENEIPLKDRELFLLPRILSVQPGANQEVCEVRTGLPIRQSLAPKTDQRNHELAVKNMSQSLEKAKRLIDIMSSERAANYSDWMTIGWALCNISEKSDTGLALWINFSQRWDHYKDETECVNKWTNQFDTRDTGVTLGTLHHFAKTDNPIEYKKLILEEADVFIRQSLEGSHNDLAKALVARYGNDYVCASLKPESWFHYICHRWEKMEDGIFLRKKISEDMVEVYTDKKNEILDKVKQCINQADAAMMQGQAKLFIKMIANLKNNSFKTNVMKECRDEFYQKDFLNLLDKNPWIIGFRNGVYDLKENRFRPGIPEDYLSLQMPIDYVEFNHDDQAVLDVHDFFVKIFPDADIRKYFLDISSEVFVGGNKRKHVYFWSGEGDNGKSVTQLFFEKMFGPYAIKLPTSLVVGKRTGSSQASPELARAGNGVRWAILQEPDKKDVLNIGILKELSGNDSFFARNLFEPGREIEPMFKLTVICNDPPSIPYSDKATWNRIRVIPFESTFTDNPPDTPEEQLAQKRFPKDPHFDKKIPNMIRAFAWVLLNHRKSNPTFVEPDKVKWATLQYKKKNDCYQQFLDENITKDDNARLNLGDLYASFKDWYKEGFPGNNVPSRADVKDSFLRIWGEPDRLGAWKGFRLTTLEDKMETGEVMVLTDKDLQASSS